MALKEVGVKLVVKGADQFKTQMSGADKAIIKLGKSAEKHSKNLTKMGVAMVAMGAAIIGAAALSVKAYAQMGDEVQKMAFKTGFSTEKLSELRHAAELSGASLSSIQKGVKTMSKALIDASRGLETYARSFEALGLNVQEVLKLQPEEQFTIITEALADVENQTLKSALAQEIFGRAGLDLLPMLAQGADGMREMADEAHELGIVFDQEAADAAALFNDNMLRLKRSTDGVKFKIAEVLLPVLPNLLDKITDIVKGITNWMSEHKVLTRVIVTGTIAMGGFLIVTGGLFIAINKLIKGYVLLRAFILTKLIPTIVIATTALWAKVTALLAVLAAAGPAGWGVLAAGIALIGTTATAVALQIHHSLKGVTDQQEELTEAVDEGTSKFKEMGREAQETFSIIETARGKGIEQAEKFVLLMEKQRKELERILKLELQRLQPLAAAFRTGVITFETFIALEAQGRGQAAVTSATAVAPISPSLNNTTNFNIDATYTNPQDPASIALDIEALTLAAGR